MRSYRHAASPGHTPDFPIRIFAAGRENLWIAKTDGSSVRQLTFERDPAVSIGVPVWSPAEDYIVFVMTRQGRSGQWIIHPDGSGLRQLVPAGVWACWSADGQWVYYGKPRDKVYSIEKVSVEGGAPILVRSDNALEPAAADGSVLYYATFLKAQDGIRDLEYRRAIPENGKSEAIARIADERVPNEAAQLQMVLSPDGKWLVAPLTDVGTTNLWVLPAGGGPMRKVTEFGSRPVMIVRRVSWSPDSAALYAAVGDSGADIVVLENLLP